MAVQRNSERLNLNAGGNAQVNTQGPGIVGPRPTRGIFDTQMAGVPQQPATVQHSVDPVVTALFGMGTALIDTKTKMDQEQAYLDGALAVGTGLSEAQLEGSPLTRAWRTAGYRDTVGRLALADYDTKVMTAMPKLREQGPEAMAQYLKAQRAELMPTFQGMSAQARGTIFTQLLTAERSALAHHNKAHTEFIVDTQVKSLQVGVAGKIDTLTRSQGNPDTNIPAMDAAFAYVKSNILENPNLPIPTRQKLVKEVMEDALAKGNVNLYEALDTLAVVPGPNGEMTTITNTLPLKDQTDLAEKYRKAYKENEFRLNSNWHSDYQNMNLSLNDPNAPKPTFEQGVAVLRTGVEIQAISADKYHSEVSRLAKALQQDQQSGDTASAVFRGDQDYLARNGMTARESADTAYQTLLKGGLSVAQANTKLLDAAANTGNPELYKIVGANVQMAISAAMTNETGKLDASQGEIISSFIGGIDRATAAGQSNAMSTALSVLPEDQRAFVLRTQGLVKEGRDPATAVMEARSMALEDAKTPAALRQARRAEVDKNLNLTVDKIQERQLSSTGVSVVKAMFSDTAGQWMAATPYRGWFDDPTATQQRVYQTKSALAEEYQTVATLYPSMNPDQWSDMAISRLNRRVVPTEHGAVILPQGTDINSYFGVAQSADAERIGWALDEAVKPQTDGGKVMFYARDGHLRYDEFTRDGQRVTGGNVDTKSIGILVDERRKQDAAKANKEVGFGVTRKGSDGTEVSFNGRNNVGVSPDLALRIRNKLVDFEDVKETPYADGSGGRKSVGVGVNSVNQHYYPEVGPDGKVSKEGISNSFMVASNGAIKAGNSAAIRWNLKSDEAVEFASVMAYQGGEGAFDSPKLRYPAMMDAINLKETDTALAELRRTPAYKAAHAERQKWYEQKVRNLTK